MPKTGPYGVPLAGSSSVYNGQANNEQTGNAPNGIAASSPILGANGKPDGSGFVEGMGYTTQAGQGGGQAGGQVSNYNTGGGPSTSSDAGHYDYADPAAFADPNAAGIYNVINNGLNNRANYAGPQMGGVSLGQTAQYGGATLAPVARAGVGQSGGAQTFSGAQLGTAQDQQYATAQNKSINALAQQAAGQGPSVAAVQAQQAAQANIAAQMAALGSQRGASNAALGQRSAADQAASANQAAAAQSVLGRTQEELNAQGQLTGALSGARGQSQTTAQTAAQLQQQAGLANQSAYDQMAQSQAALAQSSNQYNAGQTNAQALAQGQLQQQAGLANQSALNAANLQQGTMNEQTGTSNLSAAQTQQQLNDQEYNQMLNSYQQQNQTDISNQVALQQLWGSQQNSADAIAAGLSMNNTNNELGLAGAGISALGGVAAVASDRKLKTAITSGAPSLRGFLDAIGRGEVK